MVRYEQIISRMAAKIEELERENRKLKGQKTLEDIEHEQFAERLVSEVKKVLGTEESATENSGR